MASAEPEIRARLERWSEAIRNKDIDRLMSFYAPEAVYFDVVPPLRLTGSEAVRRNFIRWFEGWSSPIGQEVRDLHVAASDDIASAFMLIRASGTLKSGRDVGYWVRATVSMRQSPQGWLIAHEHVSLPVDFATGKAAMDLMP